MSRIYKVHNVTLTNVKGNTGRALVSVYNNVDHQGDRVLPGAFTNSIREWEASGDPLPFIWSHMWADPMAHIGRVTKFTDTPTGLVVDFEITDPTDFAAQVVRLLKERRVTQMSFAYDVVYERPGPDGANELVELKLIECGPCLAGANEETDLLSVKAVQAMLAAESGHTLGWAGTSISRAAVEAFRTKVAAEAEVLLDSVFEAATTKEKKPMNDELKRLEREIADLTDDTPGRDEDLLRRVEEIAGGTKTTTSVLQTAAQHLAESATRAQVAGLPDVESALLAAARALHTLAFGGEGDVEAILASLRPLVAELRSANPVAGSGLERTLAELAGGVGVPYVDNSDRVEGSVDVTEGVTDDRNRYEPKHRSDAEIIAELERLSPTKPDQKPRGHFEQLGLVATWVPDEDAE